MLARVPPVYTRPEYISDAVIHVSGIALALIGAPILVTLAAVWIGDSGIVTAMAVYAVSLVGMLTCSALYNMITRQDWNDTLRRIDQSAIYLKIAGTYTPFIALTGAQAGWLLAGIWGMAIAGASMILFARGRVRVASIALYLGLGWAGIVGGADFLGQLSTPAFILLLVGGSLYTAGVAFLLWERLPFHNTIWHVFVLAATAVCYSALLVELVRRSGMMTAAT
ncbi:PAQR family membrane homeostasis protein TrhA [Ovoidimarina sediminis]|uniref:PAQR family membrane homeostasis protein TrhA n=1 Tax=Ovoidimarina sediminis TaxID=3079856 RepID=UPI00291132E6|nr:hemolysin III family protein [Rhodophyticola sp. MJ-SS7]MDU8946013.1 hemolysin III family protein [Rhodophyticola sp. MJ-SS7]